MTTCGCAARWASSSAATARCLPGFVAYLEANGAATVTVELAVAWARLPEGIKPITVDFRLSAVRGFARYLHAIDPAHRDPTAGSAGGAAAAADALHLHTRARSPRCWPRPRGSSHRCGPPPTRRCSGCWPRPACASARRWR